MLGCLRKAQEQNNFCTSLSRCSWASPGGRTHQFPPARQGRQSRQGQASKQRRHPIYLPKVVCCFCISKFVALPAYKQNQRGKLQEPSRNREKLNKNDRKQQRRDAETFHKDDHQSDAALSSLAAHTTASLKPGDPAVERRIVSMRALAVSGTIPFAPKTLFLSSAQNGQSPRTCCLTSVTPAWQKMHVWLAALLRLSSL